MAIQFGTSQINSPTPASVNTIVRAITVAGAIFLAWMSTANIIGPNAKDIITQVLGLVLGLINGLAPLFGVPITSATISAKNVTAVDETKVN